jgi:hypothetical protein
VAADPSWVQLVMVDGDLAYGRAHWLGDLVDPADRDRLEPVLAWAPRCCWTPATLAQLRTALITTTPSRTHLRLTPPGRSDHDNAPVDGLRGERLTLPLTVRVDLQKRWSAQRWAATYSHGGSQGFKSPHLHPQHRRSKRRPPRAGDAHCHVAAASSRQVQPRRLSETRRPGPRPHTLTTQRGRRQLPTDGPSSRIPSSLSRSTMRSKRPLLNHRSRRRPSRS